MQKKIITNKWDRLNKRIEKGKAGRAVYIPFTEIYPGLSNVIDIAQDTYYLIGGDPGTGKSAFTHWTFVLYPYIWYMKNRTKSNIKIKIFVRSMERSWDTLITKWACLLMYVKFNIVVTPKQVFGRVPHKMSKDEWDKFNRCMKFLRHAEDIIEVIPGAMNPTGILVHLVRYAQSTGTTKIINKKGNIVIQDPKNPEHRDCQFVEYIADDPDLIVLNVTDHIGLLKRESVNSHIPNAGMLSEKGTLDRGSYYFRETRERYGFSHAVVQQFNRGMGSIARRKNSDLTPERQDYKGTANTVEDCDVSIGLFEPVQYQVPAWMGYDITKFITPDSKSRFRGCSVLKNSLGQDNCHFGLQFVGENGFYKEIVHPTKMTDPIYKAINLLPHAHIM